MALACAVVLGMYCTNTDMGGDPVTPRGDGHYRPVLGRGDGHMLYLMARSTALDGDWVFDNDLGRFGDPWNQPRGPTGRKLIPHPIGPALIWTPLIWTAQAGAVVANVFGAEIPLHGYTLWHQRFVFLSSVVFGCGAVLLGRRLAKQAIGGTWAPTYAAIAVLLGTSITYYATYMPGYGHAMDAFACGAFVAYWAATLGRVDLRRWLALGALLGIAMLIRVQELAMGGVLVVESIAAIVALRRTPREAGWRALAALGHGAIVLAVAFVVFSPQLLFWKLVYGDFFAVPQGALYTRLGSPMILELLYSARNGWFASTPIAYLGVIGLCCLPRRSRLLAGGLIFVVAVQVYLNSTIMDYWGMAAFGQRRLCSVTLPLVVGLAALVWRMGRLAARIRLPRLAAHGLAVLGLGSLVAWNLDRVGGLRAGLAAPSDLLPTCCDRVPGPVRGPIQWVFDKIGNPFEFPANALFALRHGTSIQDWDRAVGNYPIFPPANSLVDGTLWDQRGTWRIGAPGSEPYLVGGWTASATAERPFRWTTTPRATAIVPNVMPYGQRLTVWIAPGGASSVDLVWDGSTVAHAALRPGWNAVSFDVTDMSVGEHDLAFEATPAKLTAPRGWPAIAQPVGVAIGSIELQFLPPR